MLGGALLFFVIGLEPGVLSPALFAVLVLAAAVSTLAAAPASRATARSQRAGSGDTTDEPPDENVPRGGILLPIANPATLPALMNIAIAATRPGDPPLRALLLVRRPTGDLERLGLRAIEPRPPLLADALGYAHARGGTVEVRAMWTDDPAADIVELACHAGVHWIIIGFSRPTFGVEPLGGMVRAILENASGKPINVGVAIHGHERGVERIAAIVDESADGRAALDLAIRLGWRRECELRIYLVPGRDGAPEPSLAACVADTGQRLGRQLDVEVLATTASIENALETVGDIVIIGSSLADERGLPIDVPCGGDEHCVMVVQGGSHLAPSTGASVLPACENA